MHSFAGVRLDNDSAFDVNETSAEDVGLFGLPYSIEESSLVIVPVPWDAACSQEQNTANAPREIHVASKFVELRDSHLGDVYLKKIALDDEMEQIKALNDRATRLLAQDEVDHAQVNTLCRELNTLVEQRVRKHLQSGKSVGLVGGDHSVSLGSLAAHASQYRDLGVLHIDAHCDLRCSLDNVSYSHASVMYHAMEELPLGSLVQVGIRALCQFEADYINQSNAVEVFFDKDLHAHRAKGGSWDELCEMIVAKLPRQIYVSVDVDGLDPSFCPGTGTPVPGGLSYNDLIYLLYKVRDAGIDIVSFDLVEVGSQLLDASNAAHLLYQLCGYMSERT